MPIWEGGDEKMPKNCLRSLWMVPKTLYFFIGKAAGLSADVKVAKISLIDLGGSERGSATSSRGQARFREGANINKSLLALGGCINALAEGAKYVPYRNSKLTRLLKDSIGGNCRTVMISNISPSNLTYEDTYNTLRYADRAKKIKINLKKNILSVDFQVCNFFICWFC